MTFLDSRWPSGIFIKKKGGDFVQWGETGDELLALIWQSIGSSHKRHTAKSRTSDIPRKFGPSPEMPSDHRHLRLGLWS